MKSTLFLLLFLVFNTYADERSLEIWSRYFPTTDCTANPCGKDIAPEILESFLEKSSYLSPEKLETTSWAFVTDMSMHSSKKRGHLINLKTGAVEKFHVSHGKGSADGKGNAVKFSNVLNSKMTSLGLYLTAETYYGKHGFSLRMDGLEESNSIARERSIVIHAASYLTQEFIKKNGRAGRSWGCPAVAPEYNERIINLLKGGSLYYIYHPEFM